MDSIVFNMASMHRHGTAFYDFLRLRKAFFVDQLAWDIPHDDDVEMDQYDNPQAWYSVVLNDDGQVIGGARVMATTTKWGTHTYMLGDAMMGKLNSIPPDIMPSRVSTSRVWECTRLVVSDTVAKQSERSECLSLIVRGLAEVAAREGATELICLSLVSLVRALRSLGFPAERRGTPYVCADDGRQYALLAMPLRPAIPFQHRPMPHALPTSSRRPQPQTVHAPPVA